MIWALLSRGRGDPRPPTLATGPGAAVAARGALVTKWLAILAFFLALVALLIAFLETLTKGIPAAMRTTLTGVQNQKLPVRENLEREKRHGQPRLQERSFLRTCLPWRAASKAARVATSLRLHFPAPGRAFRSFMNESNACANRSASAPLDVSSRTIPARSARNVPS